MARLGRAATPTVPTSTPILRSVQVARGGGPTDVLPRRTGLGGLRNLDAHPHAHVSIGSRTRVPVVAQRLTPTEAAEAIRRYAARHPRASARLAPVFERTLGAPITEAGTTLPLVRLAVK